MKTCATWVDLDVYQTQLNCCGADSPLEWEKAPYDVRLRLFEAGFRRFNAKSCWLLRTLQSIPRYCPEHLHHVPRYMAGTSCMSGRPRHLPFVRSKISQKVLLTISFNACGTVPSFYRIISNLDVTNCVTLNLHSGN
ncbi:hypothetical protein RvY_12887-2 [Ramazzottius varieornatus]|uniref:Uncharacterized protein n=1 Tax=Ramazzottius varieornatus TaxID=947166 RepID=A0A1D1VL13_RAMVA|nr:hypothetical protein RvY_12887-2 [Ramazzottius varieornatus]